MTASTGAHRGVCVENRDPTGMGRIRVQVPSALGPGATGWAFPAWTGDDTSVWPFDRLPDPGEGVWVTFESPDRMTWTALFGPVVPPRGEKPEDYWATISWELGILPADTATNVVGVLTSPGGTPNPDPQVHMEKSTATTGPWTRVDSSPVDLDGDFVLTYTRPNGENNWYYRAVFEGCGAFTPISTDPARVSNKATSITISGTPVWQYPANFTGKVQAGDGTLMANRTVKLMVRTGSTWAQVGTGTTDASGNYTIPWTQPKNYTVPFATQALHVADAIYDSSASAIQEWTGVTIQPTITWNIPAMSVGVSKTITGTLTSSYGAPEPDRTLDFMTKPSGGAWAVASRPVADAAGAFSFAFTATTGICEYKMRFNGSGVYLAAESTVSSQANSVTTLVPAPTLDGTLYHGTAHTVSGTGVVDQTGAAVKYGPIRLQYRRSDSGNTWTDIADGTVSSSGTWSISATAPNWVGPVEYRGVYLGSSDGFYLASNGSGTSRNVALRGMGTLTKGSLGHTSANFSWSAPSGATQYDLYHRYSSSGGWTWLATITGTSVTRTGIDQDSYHEYYLVPMRQQAGGTWTYGAGSPSIACHTGHPAVTKSGSFGYEARPTATNTYRPVDGWGYSGDDVLQGYYSQSNYVAYGTMTYDGAAFRNWVDANYGSDVRANLNFYHCQVAMYRIAGSGNSAARGLTWYVSTASAGSGGQPDLAGGSNWGSFATGTSGWVVFDGSPHWGRHVLFNENGWRSFVIHRNNSTDYSRYAGKADASNSCNIYVECNWNFTSVAYAAPFWY